MHLFLLDSYDDIVIHFILKTMNFVAFIYNSYMAISQNKGAQKTLFTSL